MKTPVYHQHEEFQNRTQTLHELRQAGVAPYPAKYAPEHTTAQLRKHAEEASPGNSEAAEKGETPFVSIAGRLMLYRSMGKNSFAHIQDATGQMQVMFNRDLTVWRGCGALDARNMEKKLDLGDLVGLTGNLFLTHKGELTLFVKEAVLLSKTLLPLADKHAGLVDKELRYRKRWLDLIAHPEVAELFRMRSRILREIRRFLDGQQFLEVETPILQNLYGGAEARPFETHLHALDQEMFLRISPELSLKKLLIGGMDRIYEMGKVFRNEGIDRNHNPEFTLLEAYAAYWDYFDAMECVEKLFEHLALALFGTTQIPYRLQEGEEIQFLELKAPWKRISMKESLKVYAGLDVDGMSEEEIRRCLETSGRCHPDKLQHLNRGLMIAALFEVKVEPFLIQPHHIFDHPIETTPLCKPHRDPIRKQEGLVERFESFILCQEVCNAYSELNDPELQRKLLEMQAARRDAGDEEASPLDETFLEAMCQGMPPAAGFGIGIDRLVMILTQAHSIRDVLYFPWMK